MDDGRRCKAHYGAIVLAPCIVSHLLINTFAEPGLVLAAVRGEMSPR